MKNEYRIDGGVAYFTISPGLEFIIDSEDVPKIINMRWGKTSHKGSEKYYVYHTSWINGKSKGILLHRFLLNNPQGKMIDHINGNGLDNRKSNLRIADHHQNGCNRVNLGKNNKSGFRGVHQDKRTNKFIATAENRGKKYYLGRFEKAEDAAKAASEFRSKHMPFSYSDINERAGD